MASSLHASARTTPRVRAELQASREKTSTRTIRCGPIRCPMLGCEEREISLGKLPRALLGKLMPARQDETAHIERHQDAVDPRPAVLNRFAGVVDDRTAHVRHS